MSFCDFAPNSEECIGITEQPIVSDDTQTTETTVRKNGLVILKETFADHDLLEIFNIRPDAKLNSDLGGRQLLYGERYFPEMVLKMELKEDGPSNYNSERYDGYMFFQEMAWETPTTRGFARGILQEIPLEGYAGWVCYFNGEDAEERYTCGHKMVPLSTDMASISTAPDMQFSAYDVDIGFRCDIETKGAFDAAKCLMPLPVESDSYPRGEYRWSPNDRNQLISQFGFVSNGSVSENSWVNLGVIEFSSAFDSLSIGIASTLVGVITMTMF